MKDYLRSSIHQLYLSFFWPTQFKREFEGTITTSFTNGLAKSSRYLLRMLPWTVALALLLNVLGGVGCELLGIRFDWIASWFALPFFVGLGMVCGPVGMTALFLAQAAEFTVISRVLVGVAAGVTFSALIGAARRVSVILASGIVLGAGGSLAIGLNEFISAKGFLSADPAVLLLLWLVFFPTFGELLRLGLGVTAPGVRWCMAFGAAFGVLMFRSDPVHTIVVASLMLGVTFVLGWFRLVAFPFDVGLSVTTYLVARWKPQATLQAWRWCPVAWNEVIWLPLPFVGRLLALLVRQNREEGFRQIAFIASERAQQRRATLAALAEVTLDDLHADTLTNLVEVPERLNWTPDTELPNLVELSLRRFSNAAHHVGQYLSLNSPYRKRQALARAVAEIEALQRNVIAARGKYAVRLLDVTVEWLMLLTSESKKLNAQTTTREIPNPFVFGNPVAETEQNVFTGRRDIVKEIEASLLGSSQAPTLLLQGPRRTGKTSILNQLPRLLGPDFASAVVDCQNPAVIASPSTLLRYLSRELSQGLRRRKISVEPLSAASLALESFAVFDDWLDSVEQKLPKRMRLFLCLDEYERLQVTVNSGWGAAFFDALRHTLQHRPRVVIMFTGVHTFQELGSAWTDRFIGVRRVRVSFLTREEVLPLLTQPIPEFDMTYAPGALDTLITATNGQPFLTQATAFELVQLLNEEERREAMTEDVERAIERAIDSGDAYFANVWSDAGTEGQAILRAIVRGESQPDFPKARTWLHEHDVLNPQGDFAVDMVRRWVNTNQHN